MPGAAGGADSGQEGFTPAQVLEGIDRFLRYAGYEVLPPSLLNGVRPDFHARRQDGNSTYEVVGLVGQGWGEAPEAIARLAAMKSVLGEAADYILLFPPVSEYETIEFLLQEKGRWYFGLKEQGVTVWLCNPQRETVTNLLGYPRDESFSHYFVNLARMSFDAYISRRLAPLLQEEEDY